MMKRIWIAALLLLWTGVASAQIQGPTSVSAQDAGDCATASACATFTFTSTTANILVDVSGTFSGTLTFEATVDESTWKVVSVINTNGGASVTTTTTTGQFSLANSGFQRVRVRATAWASGTASVRAARGFLAARSNSIPGGTFSNPTITGQAFAPVTADCLLPSYSYTGDPNTGNTSVAADSTSQCAGGVEVTRATTTFFQSFLPVYHPNGSVGAPSLTFTSDPDTGLFWASGGRIFVVTDATHRLRFPAAAEPHVLLYGGNGIAMDGGTNNGDAFFTRAAAGAHAFTSDTGGYSYMRFGPATTSGWRLNFSGNSVQGREGDDSSYISADWVDYYISGIQTFTRSGGQLLVGTSNNYNKITYGSADGSVDHEFLSGGFGAKATLDVAETELTALSGATVTATNLIPAGSFVVGVNVRVTTLITGATSFNIGDGSDADRWGATIAVGAGTTTSIVNYTANGFGQFAAANNVVLTANGSNFTAGAVRITVYYVSLTAPTS
jgi:hypothetical protein